MRPRTNAQGNAHVSVFVGKMRIKTEKKSSRSSDGRKAPCTRITPEALKEFYGTPITFRTGQRGSRLLEVEGYTYVRNRNCDAKTYWICARKVRIRNTFLCLWAAALVLTQLFSSLSSRSLIVPSRVQPNARCGSLLSSRTGRST